jgi:hypothetical protein
VIEGVLNQVRWNRVEAARRLQISYKALLYKIAMYALAGDRPRLPLSAAGAANRASLPPRRSPDGTCPRPDGLAGQSAIDSRSA